MLKRTCVPFCGISAPNLDFLYNPTPEHKALRETVARFAKEKIAGQVDEHDKLGKMNVPLFKEFGKDLGLFGLTLPTEAGGAGMDALASVIVHHELCRVDSGFCLAYLAHAMLFVNNFFWSATKEQKERFLPDVLSGDKIGAMGMSEPEAGSDVLGMRTFAKKKKDGYVLNGSKTWITNAPHADVFLVYSKNVDHKCISTFILESNMKGFTKSPPIDKCGNRSSEMCSLYFDDVFVPEENVLGGNPNGLVGMMRNLELERVSGAGMSCGTAERCVEMMVEYSKTRKAFGQPIMNYGQIQRYIAENFAATEAAKCMTYSVARNVAPGVQNRLGTDAAKLVAVPIACRAATDCVQVLGGMGYSKGMAAERFYRDVKLGAIGAGTLEMHAKNLTKDLTAAL